MKFVPRSGVAKAMSDKLALGVSRCESANRRVDEVIGDW
jgi:hypothetical protein